ncbi:MAG: diphthamide biosynthesis enzyme Dph2 [Candidatus Bathyarchaeia archaeon]
MVKSLFDLEEKRLADEIRKHKAKRVLIQFPEGLKPNAPKIAAVVENAGAQAFISADPCYGACDLATYDAQQISADLIVHYGHTETLKQTIVPAIFLEGRANVNVEAAVKKALPWLKPWKNIGLITTVQHVHKLDVAKDILVKANKTVMIGDARRLKYAGQVIGCDYSNAKAIEPEIDAFLFVGGGKFHALGVSLATSKPTIVADPYEKRAYRIEAEAQKIRKQRMTQISEAKKAETFGVLIGLKPGQNRLKQAVEIKKKLEDKGKHAWLFVLKEIIPEALMQFPVVDAFVNTACPRLALDDASMFKKPMLTINETLYLIEEIDWETLHRKGWFGNEI